MARCDWLMKSPLRSLDDGSLLLASQGLLSYIFVYSMHEVGLHSVTLFLVLWTCTGCRGCAARADRPARSTCEVFEAISPTFGNFLQTSRSTSGVL